MAIPPEQIENLKSQLLKQLDETNLPNKEEIKNSVEEMNAEELEKFLIDNNLMQGEGQAPQQGGQPKCVFCSIVFGELPSTKIGENEKAIAILELNPISKGHTMILPKAHIEKREDLPEEINNLVEEISAKLKSKFNPKNVITENINILGHEAISVLPVYTTENFSSPKQQATPEQLAQIKSELEGTSEVKEEIKEKPKEEINEKNTWLPRRIP
jgi:histidine triad (HIT) family protein